MSYILDNWNHISAYHQHDAWLHLNNAYNESHRHYHNWNHIEFMLHKMDDLIKLVSQPNVVRNAIFWHDKIYNTKQPDTINVIQSAESFLYHTSSNYSSFKYATLSMILGSADHINAVPTIDYYPGFKQDFNLFLDLDLSSLGDTYEKFSENSLNIRKEFSWVSDKDFKIENLKIMNKFMNASPLYKLKETRDIWGDNAYNNLIRKYKEN